MSTNARQAHDEIILTAMETHFYEALKYAAPDLDFTVMTHLPNWDGMVAFRINKHPIGMQLNHLLRPYRLADQETGEDIITVSPDKLDEVILDLRNLDADEDQAEPDDDPDGDENQERIEGARTIADEVAKEAAELAAKEAGDEAAKEAGEEAYKEAADEAYKETYNEIFPEAYVEALNDSRA